MIREATQHDIGALAGIHYRGHLTAYSGFISRENLELNSEAVRQEQWRELFDEFPIEARVFVFERDGAVVGFAYSKPGNEADLPGWGEIKLLFVEPGLRGGGIGLALFEHTVGDLRARGYEPFLYTLCPNAPARRFCEARGWRHDGTRQPWPVGDQELEECRYRPG
jgi:GNAT superfamily N-acetyltransferase